MGAILVCLEASTRWTKGTCSFREGYGEEDTILKKSMGKQPL